MNCASGRTSGTCVPECPSYGLCHCGCDEPTNVNRFHQPTRGFTKGLHCINRNGHRIHLGTRGRYSYDVVPIDRVRPLARFLFDEMGGVNGAAVAAGLRRGTINGVLYDRAHKCVTGDTAARIVEAVLALRNTRQPDAPHVARQALPVLPAPRDHKPTKGSVYVDTAPLAAYVEREIESINGMGPTIARQLHRWFSEGRALLFHVDEFCIEVLQVHPIRVYGDEWPDSPSFNEQEAIA